MNVIKIKIDFEKGLCQKEGISVVTGDYNSTKIEFEFNESAADGRKIFELKNSDDELVYVDEIVNNEVILVGKREEEGEEKLFSLFNKEGDYTFEVSLYGENSKLTSVYDYITARKEQVIVDDETVEQYMPLFDNLMQELSNKVAEADSKIDEIDQAIEEVNQAVEDAEEAVESTNNLNIDVNKVDKTTQVDLTKKDGTTKTVYINDGTSLQFMWQGTSLGIKTDDMEQYVFVNLQGIQGQPGPQGEPFRIKKTYTSVAEMNADFDNMNVGDYVMIASTVEIEDNAKLYVKGDSQWIFITDFSGATGIKGETGATPIIRIGTVTSGSTPSVTISGTAEEPVFNFVLQPGAKGEKGDTGLKGDTGNGIASIVKTASAGLIDTYTITFTDGTTSTFNVTNGQDGDVTQEYVDEENERLKSVFNVLPKVSDSGESVTLNDTGDTMLYKMDLKGNTSQEVIQGEVGLEEENTSIYVDDVNEDKENYITLKGNTYQDSTSGKNLLPNNITSQTINGITITKNNDGSLLINGTSNATTILIFGEKTLQAGTYTLSTHKEGAVDNSCYISSVDTSTGSEIAGSSFRMDNSNSKTYTLSETTTISYRFYTGGSRTFTNFKIYPMLEQGSSATDYEPYTNGASPNPDYPQEIEVVTGENEVKVEGKNLFDKDSASLVQKGVNSTTGMIFDTNTKRLENDNLILLQVGTYTISNAICDNVWVWAYDLNQNYLYQKIMLNWYTGNSYTFTINEDLYIRFIWKKSDDSEININDNFNIQLEVGTTATTYEAYKGQTYEVNLGSIELCKIGDYQDRIYKDSGKWYLHKEIGKVVLDGDTNKVTLYGNYGDDNKPLFYMNKSDMVIPSAYTEKILMSDNYTQYIGSTPQPMANNQIRGATSTGRIYLRDDRFTTASDFNTQLQNSNVLINYVLATPTNTEITDATLVNQLEDLYTANIHTITHINTETSNLLPYIDLKYNVVTASPSPDRASEVEVVTGNNTIKIQSKNLLNTKIFENRKINCYVVNSNGTITQTATDTNFWQSSYLPNSIVLNSGTYTISVNNRNGSKLQVYNLTTNSNIVEASVDSYTFTLNNDNQVINAKLYGANASSYPFTFTMQLEQNSTATSYVPYQSQSYNITLGNLELCKIGDYQDYFYKDSGKWYVHKEVGKVVFDGTEYWEGGSSATVSTNYTYVYTQVIDSLAKTGVYTCFNNKLDTLNGPMLADTSVSTDTLSCGSSGYNRVRIMILTSRLSSANVNGFKSWLSNNNVTLYYVLTTPTTTQITDQLLVSQLDELQKAMSYYDKTIITQTNADKPFILDVIGIRDLQDIFNLISGE